MTNATPVPKPEPPPSTSEKEAEHEREEIRKAIDETEAPTRVEVKNPKKPAR